MGRTERRAEIVESESILESFAVLRGTLLMHLACQLVAKAFDTEKSAFSEMLAPNDFTKL